MGKIVVTNKAGKEEEVEASALPYLEPLGYTRKDPDAIAAEREHAQTLEENSGLGSRALALGEGVVSGATFGLADPLMDDNATRAREENYGGTVGAGKVIGMVAGAVLGGEAGAGAAAERGIVGKIAAATPAGIAARAGEAAGLKVAKTAAGRLIVSGGVEGLGQATGQMLGSILAGDDVTPEGIVDELGYGTLFGLGAGALGAGAVKALDKLKGIGAVASKVDDAARTGKADVRVMDNDVALFASQKTQAAQSGKFGGHPIWDSPQAQSYDAVFRGHLDDAQFGIRRRLADLDEQVASVDRDLARAGYDDDVSALRESGQSIDTSHPFDLEAAAAVGDEEAIARLMDDGGVTPVDDHSGSVLRNWIADAGDGVPLKIPARVREAAAAKGLEIGPEMSPGELIERLKAKLGNGSGERQGLRIVEKNPRAPGVGRRADIDPEFRQTKPEMQPRAETAPLPGRAGKGEASRWEPPGTPVVDVGPNGTKGIRGTGATEEVGQVGTDTMVQSGSTMDPIHKELFAQASKLIEEQAKLRIALRGLEQVPDLSLSSLARMSPDELQKAVTFLDSIQSVAPGTLKPLTDDMGAIIGGSAKNYNPMEVIARHQGHGANWITKMGNVSPEVSNVVALWSSLKGLDAELGRRATGTAFKDGVAQAAESLGRKPGSLAKKAATRAAGKANEGAPGTKRGPIQDAARYGVAHGVKRAVKGAIGGGIAAGTIGYAMGWGVANSVVGGALAGGSGGGLAKMSATAKRVALTALEKTLRRVPGRGRGAVASFLSTHDKLKAPSSPYDTTHEDYAPGEMLAARIDDAHFAASPAGRERLAATLTPIRSVSPELAKVVEDDARRRAEYLSKHAPRKPAWSEFSPIPWVYSEQEASEFAARYRAVTNPTSVLEDTMNGSLTPQAADALRETSPGLFRRVVQYTMENVDPSTLDDDTAITLSLLTGIPFHPMLQPEFIGSFQADFNKPIASNPAGPNAGAALGPTSDTTPTNTQNDR